jgi:Holliday junction resolvase RusA-like endonuclease
VFAKKPFLIFCLSFDGPPPTTQYLTSTQHTMAGTLRHPICLDDTEEDELGEGEDGSRENPFSVEDMDTDTTDTDESPDQAPGTVVTIKLERNPKPQQSARVVKNGHFYNPSKHEKSAIAKDARKYIKDTTAFQDGDFPLFRNEAVVVEVDFYLRRPKEDFVGENRRSGRLKPAARWNVAPPARPDWDNLAKLHFDALQGIAYTDDKQIVGVTVKKRRDNVGRCVGRSLTKIRAWTPADKDNDNDDDE